MNGDTHQEGLNAQETKELYKWQGRIETKIDSMMKTLEAQNRWMDSHNHEEMQHLTKIEALMTLSQNQEVELKVLRKDVDALKQKYMWLVGIAVAAGPIISMVLKVVLGHIFPGF